VRVLLFELDVRPLACPLLRSAGLLFRFGPHSDEGQRPLDFWIFFLTVLAEFALHQQKRWIDVSELEFSRGGEVGLDRLGQSVELSSGDDGLAIRAGRPLGGRCAGLGPGGSLAQAHNGDYRRIRRDGRWLWASQGGPRID